MASSHQLITISQALDFNLEQRPDHPFYIFNADSALQNTVVTHLEFTRATHRAASALPRAERQVVCLIANLDTITYHAITAGIMRAGYIPFPISPRLSPAAIINLLQKTSSHWILTTHETLGPLIDAVKAELAQADPGYALQTTETPGLGDLFPRLGSETSTDLFDRVSSPSSTSWDDTALYLHSSGSTGFPKAIPLTHRILAEWGSHDIVKSIAQSTTKLSGIALPAFHMMGIYIQFLNPIYGFVPVTVYPPTVVAAKDQPILPTPDNIVDHLRRTESDGLMTIPAMLHAWAQSPEAVDLLKTFSFVGYSGGPISKKIGDELVASGINLKPIYGGTEFGVPSVFNSTRGEGNEWEWIEFDSQANIRWVDEGNGKYEYQILNTVGYHTCVENITDGYATFDLFERHPTKPNLWKIVGRKDDVIIHSSGEKTVPGPMEEIMSSSPFIAGVVMFGREHDQAGVLIEPLRGYAIDPSDSSEVATFRNKVWSVIEEANKGAPAFSRIFKEMILVASPTKLLPRSAKGTVQRKQALEVYAEEISELYNVVEASKGTQDVVPPEDWQESTVRSWILKQVQDIVSGREIDPSMDLFDQGFDSLSATFLRLRISGALSSEAGLKEVAAKTVGQNVVYAYPTVDALAAFVAGIVNGGLKDARSGPDDRVAGIERMIEKYSVGLDSPILRKGVASAPALREVVVLITGTTGNLGAEVLANLVMDERVRRVYALNRRSTRMSVVQRHRERFEDKGLDVGLLESTKLTFLEGDTGDEKLGLEEWMYDELKATINLIVHVAWKLDFNLTLTSFEHNIKGTRRLIDLARESEYASELRFLFTSSVSAAQSWDKTLGAYPEEVVADARYAVGGGYGEGKYVSERLLAKSGLHATSLRIGQVSGGLPNGAWATTDWVPILFKSSLALGVIPTSQGVASWIPMDAVSDAMTEIAFAEAPSVYPVVNIVHTRPVSWNEVIVSVQKALEKIRPERPLRFVPMGEWVGMLEQKAKEASSESSILKDMPAVKLLDFFRAAARAAESAGDNDESGGLARFSTDNAQIVSARMRGLRPLGYGDAARWVHYWDKRGFFD